MTCFIHLIFFSIAECLNKLLVYLDVVSPLITLFIFLSLKSALKEKSVLNIFCFLFVQFMLNCIADIMAVFKINNHIIFHINCTLSIFFLFHFFEKIGVLKNRHITFFLFLITYITYLVIEKGMYEFNSIGFALASIIIIILSFKYYYRLLKNPQVDNFFLTHNFWFVTGLFTYYVCTFITFITYGYLSKFATNVGMLWKFQNILLTILCIYLIKGVLCKKKEMISYSSL